MNDEEFMRQIMSGDFWTSDEDAYISNHMNKTGKNTQPRESQNDIDKLLAEIRAEYLQDPPSGTQPNGPQDTGQGNSSGDDALSREMLEQMKELTKEVKLLRSQLKSETNNLATYPRGEPRAGNESEPEADKPKKQRGKFWWIGEVAFYFVLIVIIVGAFLIKSNSGGRPTLIAGFSGFTVLTSSMEDTIPKGSLVITRSVDPNTLKVGDDITYMSSATSTITHRIIEIQEDYLDTNARAFITKGTMNKNQDKYPVAAANVVGKVVFHSKTLGNVATFLSKNWPIVLFIVVILVVLIWVLKWIFSKEEPEKEPAREPRYQTQKPQTQKYHAPKKQGKYSR